MQKLLLARVEVDWCASCRALWFDRGELVSALGITGAPAMTREQPACRCPACRRGMLWFSRIDGSEVLACVDCAGCFVSEQVLQRRGAVPPSGLVAEFVCAVCGDSYQVASAHETKDGLACSRCVPPEPPAPPAVDGLLARIIAMLRG